LASTERREALSPCKPFNDPLASSNFRDSFVDRQQMNKCLDDRLMRIGGSAAGQGDLDMIGSFRKTAAASLAALAISAVALATPASAFGGSTWHGGHAGGWHGGWHGGWGGAAVGAGVGLAAGALAGAALATPYYYGGCDPYYGCGYGSGPAYGYAPSYGYAPAYGYGPQGGNSGGANFPQ
jgi:hypothetical protein